MTELTSQEPEQHDEPPVPGEPADEISYEQFGLEFFREAVTPARILGAIHALAAEPIEFGPMGVGPGRIARVSAKGQIGEPVTTQLSEQPVTFQVNLPVALAFTLDLLVDTHRFDADVTVPLTISAHARDPLTIYIDVTPPRGRDLNVVVKGDSVRAELMRKVADIDTELRRFIAKYISRELDKPAVRALRTIDVAAIMAKAWPGEGGPATPGPT